MNKAKQGQVTWAEFKQLHPRRAHWIIVSLAIVLGMIIGMVNSPAPETVEVSKEVPVVKEVTPQACRDALAIDNQVFIKVGTALETMEFTDAVNYLVSVKDQRLSLYGRCVGEA